MSTDLPPELLDYFATRQQQRADRANTALSVLSRYERRIVREAAGMGYVLGYRSGNLDGRDGLGGPLDNERRIPGDSDILRSVLEHCDSTSDLYPYLGAACNGRRRRITKARLWPGEAAR